MVSYGMDLASELAPFSPSSELLSWVEKRVNGLLEQLDTRATEIRLRDAKIEKLTLELAHLRRLKFGVKSESLTASERDLFDETLAADVAACEARLAEQRQAAAMGPHLPLPEKAKRERAGRQPLPEHLPRVEHLHEPETCTCGQCGQALMRIGEDVTEKLSIVPAEFFVERHIYPKYACRPCETLIAAPAVASIIDGGLAAPALLAWVMVSKYADHLPLYRLERQAARSGVTLSRSTLADWVGRTGVALEPLWLRLAELLRQGAVLHADETPVQQLDPGNGKTKRAYLWAYRSNALASDPPITVFDYQPGRGGKYVAEFLRDWQGALMVDEFAGYQALFRGEVIELACMAHARRKFFDLHRANGSPSQPRPCAASASCTPSRSRQRERRSRSGPDDEKRPASRCSKPCTYGSRTPADRWPTAVRWPRRSTTVCGAGRPLPVMPRTVSTRSTTTPSRMPFARSPSARRIGCSPVPRLPANAPRRFNRCSKPPAERHRAHGLADRHPGETPLLAEQPHRRAAASQKATVSLRAQGWVR
jgi:transposase